MRFCLSKHYLCKQQYGLIVKTPVINDYLDIYELNGLNQPLLSRRNMQAGSW